MGRIFLSIIIFLLPLTLVGQTSLDSMTITGRIAGLETGEPLADANVMIEILGIGDATNARGLYRIDLPLSRVRGPQVELTVRYIGYQTARIVVLPFLGTTILDLYLSLDVLRLKEIEIIADRAEKERGYASQKITSEELRQTGASNLADALTSRIAGLQVMSNTGVIGAAPAFQFRGDHYLNPDITEASEFPLIVVDGMPLPYDFVNGKELNDTILDIGIADIESIEVVPGPAMVWRYGTRATRGAILITTKSASAGSKR